MSFVSALLSAALCCGSTPNAPSPDAGTIKEQDFQIELVAGKGGIGKPGKLVRTFNGAAKPTGPTKPTGGGKAGKSQGSNKPVLRPKGPFFRPG